MRVDKNASKKDEKINDNKQLVADRENAGCCDGEVVVTRVGCRMCG